MRKMLHSMLCAGAILFGIQTTAQVKGDPDLKTMPQAQSFQKTSSKLNPELQKLYDRSGTERKDAKINQQIN